MSLCGTPVTGQLPFKGVHETAMLYEIVNVDPAPMSAVRPEIDPELDRIVLECLQKEPEDRYQSARELAKDLRRAKRESGRKRLSGVSAVRPAIPSGSRPEAAAQALAADPRPAGRGRLPMATWVFAGLAALSAALALVLLFTREAPLRERIEANVLPPEGEAFLPGAGVAFSPDGTHLAFVTRGSADARSLWVRALGSSVATRLVEEGNPEYPFWSPDGRSLGFFTDTHLRRVDASGGAAVSICPVAAGEGGTWNAEGTILFAHSFSFSPVTTPQQKHRKTTNPSSRYSQ